MTDIITSNAPVIDIQTVWSYFVGIEGGDPINLERDAPFARPPFEEMVMQWQPPGWPHPMQCRVFGGDGIVRVQTEIHVPFRGAQTAMVEVYALTDESGMPTSGIRTLHRTPRRKDAPPSSWSGWHFAESNAALCLVATSFMHLRGARLEDPPKRTIARPTANFNRRRKAIQEIKILRIEPLERYLESLAAKGGSRRTRLHVVRGHWRHYEEHKTWIKWHLRGDPDLGFIQKHYSL